MACMALVTAAAQATTLQDGINYSGFVTRVNAILAPLLDRTILLAAILNRSQQRVEGHVLGGVISHDVSSTTLTDPFVLTTFTGSTLAEVNSAAIAFRALNPGWFYAPLQIQYLNQPGLIDPWVAYQFYSEDPNGTNNWGNSGTGGAPGGPAGGDLAGTYPNPTVAQITGPTTETAGLTAGTTAVDSAAFATYDSVLWDITLVRTDVAGNRYSEMIKVTHDGVTPYDQSMGTALVPGAAGEVSVAVVISGANIELRVTVTAGTWTAKVRRLSFVS